MNMGTVVRTITRRRLVRQRIVVVRKTMISNVICWLMRDLVLHRLLRHYDN
jgi:hypothetical protein